eukprot:3706353-Prymnesium_polylepis.1
MTTSTAAAASKPNCSTSTAVVALDVTPRERMPSSTAAASRRGTRPVRSEPLPKAASPDVWWTTSTYVVALPSAGPTETSSTRPEERSTTRPRSK